MEFRPEAGRRLSREKLRVLRALVIKRKQLVDIRKRHSMYCKVDKMNETACEFEVIAADLREVLDLSIDTLNSAFHLLVACCLAIKSSAKSDGLRVLGRNAGFQGSNRQPLLGILGF